MQASCYNPIALLNPKMLCIVKENFTIKSRISRFVLPILGWVYLLLKPTYQAAEIVRYSNYICHKSIKSDSWESGKVSVV